MTKVLNIESILKPELIFMDKEYNNQKELLSELHNKLYEKNYVYDSYHDAIIKREIEFSTGLNTGTDINVAIPHTDPEHIKKPFISIIQLAKPITFNEMGTDNQNVSVSLIVALGLTKSEDQLILLQKLMKLFIDAELMQSLNKETELNEFYNAIINRMKEVQK